MNKNQLITTTPIEAAIQNLYKENQRLFDFQPDYNRISNTIQLYENLELFNNTLLLFYDHKKMRLIYAGANSAQIIGYTSEELKNFGFGFYLKVFHPSHLGFPFRQVRIERKLFPIFKHMSMLDRKVYIGGLKLIHKNGTVFRGFFKTKTIIVSEDNKPELSIIQGQDFSHLFKGDSYWIRLSIKNSTYCYVSHSKRKEYKDLISPKELDVLRLVAQNKSTPEIAEQLNLSKQTINTHRKNMIARTGVVNSTALTHLCKTMEII